MNSQINLDTKQKILLNNLLNLKEKLEKKENIIQKFLFSAEKPSDKMGFYIYGKVGRGKTSLMNIFYEKLNIKEKMKIHFHKFMQDIHQEIFNYKNLNLNKDALIEIAKKLSNEYKVICLDELTIDNIADAMIVGRLFENLLNNNIHIIITSNFHPDELYKDGLQRENFLKFIRIIIGKLEIKNLDNPKDYRREYLADKKTFITPANQQNNQKLLSIFEHIIQFKEVKNFILESESRQIMFEKSAGNVIFTDFSEICGRAIWVQDYLNLVEKFNIFFITNIPVFNKDNINEAKRFTTLIDILYDNKIILFATLADTLENLFKTDEKFARTESRMIEMQSGSYYNKT